jgi:hypothetical protein
MSRGDGSKFVTTVRLGFGVVALGLLIAFVWRLSADYAEHSLDARHHAQQNASSARDRAQWACRRVEPLAVDECKAEQIAAARDDQRSEYDLSAQQQMADWAFWMMAVSAVTMAVAIWALWYVKGTLDETRAMTTEAKNTTAAAEAALRETQRVAAAELRPWVTIEAKITKVKKHANRVEVDYSVTFRNIGKTIATDVRMESAHDFLGERAVDGIDFRYASWTDRESSARPSALIPGEEITLPASHARSLDSLPWIGTGTAGRMMLSVVIASVFYRSKLDANPHRTDRSFLFGWPGEDSFDHRYFFEDNLGGAAENLVISPFRPGETS